MHKHLAFLVMAGFLVSSVSVAHADDQVFPPENLSECHEGSLLRWDGPGHAVRCEDASSAVLPTGTILAFDLPQCPSGWGPWTPGVSRTLIGAGGQTPLGETGGSNSVSLTVEQMPRHSHDLRLTGQADDHNFGSLWQFDYGARGYLEFDWLTYTNGKEAPVETGGPPSGPYEHSFIAARGDGFGPFATNNYAGGTAELGEGQAKPFDNRQAYVGVLYCRKSGF